MDDVSDSSNQTKSEKFFRFFQREVKALDEQLEPLTHPTSETTGNERSDAIGHCSARIKRLQEEIQDATTFTPVYDQRTYADTIKTLTDKLQKAKTTNASKPKFSFKSRKVMTAPAIPQTQSTPVLSETASSSAIDDDSDGPYDKLLRQNSEPRIRKPSFSNAETIKLTHHDFMHIALPACAAHAMTTGKLAHLNGCIVDLSSPSRTPGTAFAGLVIKDVQKSLLVSGDVRGAAHVTNVDDSVIVVSCQQFRMHDCHNVDVYLSCTSRPIIENSMNIQFAPLPAEYTSPGGTSDLHNMWDQVDDFQWLKQGPSPNWKVLPEPERIKGNVWKDVVPGSAQYGLRDILFEVGVEKGRTKAGDELGL